MATALARSAATARLTARPLRIITLTTASLLGVLTLKVLQHIPRGDAMLGNEAFLLVIGMGIIGGIAGLYFDREFVARDQLHTSIKWFEPIIDLLGYFVAMGLAVYVTWTGALLTMVSLVGHNR